MPLDKPIEVKNDLESVPVPRFPWVKDVEELSNILFELPLEVSNSWAQMFLQTAKLAVIPYRCVMEPGTEVNNNHAEQRQDPTYNNKNQVTVVDGEEKKVDQKTALETEAGKVTNTARDKIDDSDSILDFLSTADLSSEILDVNKSIGKSLYLYSTLQTFFYSSRTQLKHI